MTAGLFANGEENPCISMSGLKDILINYFLKGFHSATGSTIALKIR